MIYFLNPACLTDIVRQIAAQLCQSQAHSGTYGYGVQNGPDDPVLRGILADELEMAECGNPDFLQVLRSNAIKNLS